MKNILISSAMLAAVALGQAQPHYLITDLGPKGNPFAQATSLNNSGVVTGVATAPDGTQHAVLWHMGQVIDISQPGLGGPNTGAFGVNEAGQVAFLAESSAKDPNNENFCGLGTGFTCLAALWQGGVLIPLPLIPFPTPGGVNTEPNAINNRGEIAGVAESNVRDLDCPSKPSVNGTGPFVFDFQGVIWGPKPGQLRQLPPLAGDTVSNAMGINDHGQAVGVSGLCSNTLLPPFVAGPHAVLWDTDGSVHDLGNLGGTVDPTLLAVGNAALAINNQGQVVGTSATAGNTIHHPFLWTKQTGIQDLGLLDGDMIGAGLAINNQGDVVGASVGGPGPLDHPRAAVWSKGEKFDLNDRVVGSSPLYLLTAFGINDAGQIVGFGVDGDGNVHGFLATPAQTKAAAGPKDTTVTLRSIQLDGTQSTSEDGSPVRYFWSIPQGSPSAAISGGNTATPTVTFSMIRGTYTFQLTITDSSGKTSTDVATVNFLGK